MVNGKGAFKLHRDVTLRSEDRVCFHRTTGCVAMLNDTGFAFVTLLDGSRTLREIAEIIAAKGKVSPELVEGDLRIFLDELRSAGFTEP